VYVEAGYSDSNSVGYTARVLNAVGVSKIRGFFTNDTHEAWTIDEVRWATAISRRTSAGQQQRPLQRRTARRRVLARPRRGRGAARANMELGPGYPSRPY
jgi:hypothetical protein